MSKRLRNGAVVRAGDPGRRVSHSEIRQISAGLLFLQGKILQMFARNSLRSHLERGTFPGR